MGEKKKLRRTCWCCTRIGTVGETVHWTEDPFGAEIYDDHSKGWLCDDCIEHRAEDI